MLQQLRPLAVWTVRITNSRNTKALFTQNVQRFDLPVTDPLLPPAQAFIAGMA